MLSEKKKELLRQFVDNKCEECGKTQLESESKLQPHRINQGMEYSIRNIKMVCINCHKIFNSTQNKSARIFG